MAYYLRPPKVIDGGRVLSSRMGADQKLVFIHYAPLVAHDRCTDAHGAGGHPWDAGREAFSALAGLGWDWCWSHVYSLDPETAPPCYWCREPVLGRG